MGAPFAASSRLAVLLAALLATTSASCSNGPPFLFVDLRTDLVPGVEFADVETILTPEGSVLGTTLPHGAAAGEDYVSGQRIAEFTTAPRGALTLHVRLRLADGALVLERTVAVDLEANLVVTVVVTRGCRGVGCPMRGDPASATECYAGRCVPSDCFVEHAASCGPNQCATSADCHATSSCATFECVDGTCLARATPGACTSAEYCSVDRGCQPLASSCVPNAVCDTGNPCELGRLDCSSGAGVCRVSGPSPGGNVCRAARDACDAPENCDGTSTACPADVLAPAGTPCGTGYCNGLGTCAPCTAGAACATTNPCERGVTDCSTGASRCVAMGPAPSGTACRAAADVCDRAETCDGTSTTCPTDAFEPSSVVCRTASGACDAAERCTGSAATCPPDALAPTSLVCRPSAAPCDAPESCDGLMLSCPADAAPVSGCSSAFRTAGTTSFVVPVACTSLRIRAWGAGGGHGSSNFAGGAGGYAEGVVTVTPGETLTIVVGAPGASSVSSAAALGGMPGGGRGGSASSQGGGGGGGYSGVFRGAMTQAGALVIGGGGGGSGGGSSAGSRVPGAGGGTVGQSGGGGSAGGGTQTAGGAAVGGATAGTALHGGNGGSQGSGDGGGGAGGGYFGGGGGNGANTDANGGGGGSGFVVGGATAVVMSTGSGTSAGNASDPLRMGAGDVRTAGAVLLDCL